MHAEITNNNNVSRLLGQNCLCLASVSCVVLALYSSVSFSNGYAFP